MFFFEFSLSILTVFTQGKREGVDLTREKVTGAMVHKKPIENTIMTNCISNL
jgi:hypothetical protein